MPMTNLQEELAGIQEDHFRLTQEYARFKAETSAKITKLEADYAALEIQHKETLSKYRESVPLAGYRTLQENLTALTKAMEAENRRRLDAEHERKKRT